MKKLQETNKLNKHGHKLKLMDSSDTRMKMNKILDSLDWLYITKPHIKVLSEQVFLLCEALSKYLKYMKDQVARTSETQNVTETVQLRIF